MKDGRIYIPKGTESLDVYPTREYIRVLFQREHCKGFRLGEVSMIDIPNEQADKYEVLEYYKESSRVGNFLYALLYTLHCIID
jgi:hypothetical protein